MDFLNKKYINSGSETNQDHQQPARQKDNYNLFKETPSEKEINQQHLGPYQECNIKNQDEDGIALPNFTQDNLAKKSIISDSEYKIQGKKKRVIHRILHEFIILFDLTIVARNCLKT